MNYVLVRDTATGQTMLFAISDSDLSNPDAAVTQALGPAWRIVSNEMPGINGQIISSDPDTLAAANAWVEEQNILSRRGDSPDTPVTGGDGAPELTKTEREARSRQNQYDSQNEAYGKVSRDNAGNVSQGGQRVYTPMSGGGLIYATDDATGDDLTYDQYRQAQISQQLGLEAEGIPFEDQVDQYGRRLPLAGATTLGLDALNQRNSYQPLGEDGTRDEPLPGNTTSYGDNQPYTMTGDNVGLHNIINNGGTPDDFARYYMNQNNLDGSMSGDFAMNNWDYYDDLWAMANPGMAMPDSFDMYNNTAQFMGDMQGNGPMVGTLDAYSLWDNQFSDPYMTGNVAMGDTDGSWAQVSDHQYQQIMRNVAAMSPSMGTRNAKMIMGLIDRSYQDYRQMALTGNTMNGMSFLQYLQSIGAADWF